MRKDFRSAWAVAGIILSVDLHGCGPSTISPENAGSIPVHNPSPDNPLKDVTLENESQNLSKIGGISKPGGR